MGASKEKHLFIPRLGVTSHWNDRYDLRDLKYLLPLLTLCLFILPGCPTSPPSRPSRDKLRIVMPASYRAKVEALMASGATQFTIKSQDIDWVDLPVYSGRDAVFAPSMAARLPSSEPDADAYFIDLYRLGSFRAEWLSPFDEGPFASIESDFRRDFLHATRLDGKRAFAVPWSAKGNFLFYRRDLVSTPPRTIGEVRERCVALVEKGLPRQLRYCLLIHWDTLENDLYPMLWGLNGGQEVDLSGAELRLFLEELAGSLGEELAGGFLMMPRAEDMVEVGNRVHRRIAGGEAVFAVTWNNRLEFMKEDLQKQGKKLPPIGIAPVPAPRKGDAQFSNAGPWGWIVPSLAVDSTESGRLRHDRAMQFVSEVTSRTSVEWLVKTYGIIPARTDVALPAGLSNVLDPAVVSALEGNPTTMTFKDRGADSLTHGFVRDAARDVLMCRTAAIKPLPSGLLGDCARYFEQCSESADVSVDCLDEAIKRRLESAQRNIEITRGSR